MKEFLDAPLILASASPRRKEILEAHGHSPIVIPAGVDETIPEDKPFTPEETVIYLAELKATAVLKTLAPENWTNGCTILGVDTIVYRDRIIGKPVDEEDALDILRSLKNASHEVISGVCIIRALPQKVSTTTIQNNVYEKPQGTSFGQAQAVILQIVERRLFSDTTTVRFGDYSDEEILNYIRANPPYDKSGSYAIQSDWGRHALDIDGDIENVIGLPYKRISAYLRGSTSAASLFEQQD